MKLKIINSIPRIVIQGHIINNGVKIRRDFILSARPIVFFEQILAIYSGFANKYRYNYNNEGGVFYSHLRVTKPSDKILAIGLGQATTLIAVVKMLDNSGFYRCIESSESQIKIASENINLNEIDRSKYEIINGYAGKEIFGSYGNPSENPININDFDFNILEMDCEGSELSILNSLTKTPDYIIVEVHPYNYPGDFSDFELFIDFMKSKEYRYECSFGHNGDMLNFNDASNYYNLSINRKHDCMIANNSHMFRVCPIVVTFARDKAIVEDID